MVLFLNSVVAENAFTDASRDQVMLVQVLGSDSEADAINVWLVGVLSLPEDVCFPFLEVWSLSGLTSQSLWHR